MDYFDFGMEHNKLDLRLLRLFGQTGPTDLEDPHPEKQFFCFCKQPIFTGVLEFCRRSVIQSIRW